MILFDKTVKVVDSCTNLLQLQVAKRYVKLAMRKFNDYEKSEIVKFYCHKTLHNCI